MMVNSLPMGAKASPDTPVKLPKNRLEPVYISDLMVDELSALGVEYAFLLPGSSFRGLHDSLVNYGRNDAPQIILATNEALAMSMAHGYAKAAGDRPGVCILHDLVGLMQGTMGVYNAWCDHAPVMVLGGSGPLQPEERRFIDWAHSASTQAGLVADYAKWTDDPPTAVSVLESIGRAYRIAATPPAGPTYVSVDCLLQEKKIPDGLEVPPVDAPRYHPPPVNLPTPETLTAAAELLIAADLPVIAAGRIGTRVMAGPPLMRMAEALGAACVDDSNYVSFPTNHPLNLTGDSALISEADCVLSLDVPDLMQALGLYSSSRSGIAAGGERAGTTKVIDVSQNELALKSWSHFGGPVAPIDIVIDCEPLAGLSALSDMVCATVEGDSRFAKEAAERTRRLAERHEKLRAEERTRIEAVWDDGPIRIHRLAHDLFHAVKGTDWLLASMNLTGFGNAFWEFDGPGQFMGASGGGGVGYSTGASVGVALAARDQGRFCVSIVGDGDFIMGPGAIWTAVHHKAPLLLVIKNNASWGNDEAHQIEVAHMRDRPPENAWIGQRMDGPNIDFAAMARSCGAWAEGPVDQPADLKGVFADAVSVVKKGGVAVVDVRTAL